MNKYLHKAFWTLFSNETWSEEWSVLPGGVREWSFRFLKGGNAAGSVTSRSAGEMTLESWGGQILMGFVCHPYKDLEPCGLGLASFN